MYSDSFKAFVEKASQNQHFVGIGNPNSNILLIGKESAISPEDEKGQAWYKGNSIDWKNHIENNTSENCEYDVIIDNHLRKSWGKNTWSKYQKLSDLIWEKKPAKFKVDFLKSAFTTEINDSPEQTTAKANKDSIVDRKLLFKNAIFIQDFPVIILACSNYIRNHGEGEEREIDSIFGVTYDGDESGKYVYSEGNWFYTHHNPDKSKLVIHTRQLSTNVVDKMLVDMAKVIREHLISLNN